MASGDNQVPSPKSNVFGKRKAEFIGMSAAGVVTIFAVAYAFLLHP